MVSISCSHINLTFDEVGTWLGNIRDRMVKFTDERVKLTNEVLQGIRVVKLYAWETPCEERIQTLRTQEVAELSKYLGLKMINLVRHG